MRLHRPGPPTLPSGLGESEFNLNHRNADRLDSPLDMRGGDDRAAVIRVVPFYLLQRPDHIVREMGIKENFTPDEWENLTRLPYAVSMTVMLAAPNMLGIWGETKAMMQQPAGLAAASGSSLVGLILAEMQTRARDLVREEQTAWRNDQGGYREKILEACRSAAAALVKISPEEAQAYKGWVIAIGNKVAEASKEGGVPVSEPEKAALAEIAGALDAGTA